jgi:hypothetical protein
MLTVRPANCFGCVMSELECRSQVTHQRDRAMSAFSVPSPAVAGAVSCCTKAGSDGKRLVNETGESTWVEAKEPDRPAAMSPSPLLSKG